MQMEVHASNVHEARMLSKPKDLFVSPFELLLHLMLWLCL